MPTIVLIHGSTQNPSCWDLVRPFLEDAGHEVVAVDLPHDRADYSATELARRVVDKIPLGANELVVVAHSASGMLVPFIAQQRPVAAVVYLAAVIPKEGLSGRDQFERDPGMLDPKWVDVGPRWRDPNEWHELAERFLFHDVQLSLRDWAHTTLRVTRFDGALREVSPGPLPPGVRAFNVVCELDRTINPLWQERVWPGERGTLSRLRAGHCPHISTARETAAQILWAADGERWELLRRTAEQMKCRRDREVPPQFAPLPEPISYEALMALKGRERFEVIIRMTPENKAEVMKIHLRRWTDAHRDSLSSEQIALLEEHLEFIRPDLYIQPRREEDLRRRNELIERSMMLFSREEIAEALSIRGPWSG